MKAAVAAAAAAEGAAERRSTVLAVERVALAQTIADLQAELSRAVGSTKKGVRNSAETNALCQAARSSGATFAEGVWYFRNKAATENDWLNILRALGRLR
jgi:membrane protein involved in colicin uptake